MWLWRGKKGGHHSCCHQWAKFCDTTTPIRPNLQRRDHHWTRYRCQYPSHQWILMALVNSVFSGPSHVTQSGGSSSLTYYVHSSMPTSMNFFIPSSPMSHGNSGILTSLSKSHCFLQASGASLAANLHQPLRALLGSYSLYPERGPPSQ